MRKLYKSKALAILSAAALLTTGLSFTSFAATDETENLVAYYSFNDPWNLGKDNSGNGNDLGTVNEANIASVTGTSGDGVYFGGSAGLAIENVSNDDGTYAGDFLDNIGGSFTISYYAKVDTSKATTANARVFSAGNNGSDEGCAGLAIYLGDNKLRYHPIVGTTGWWSAASEVSAADSWHQFVMVYDAETLKLTAYVDGVQTAQVAATADEPESNWNFCIGGCWAQWDWFADKTATTESFIGSVDEFKVFKGAIYSIDDINRAEPANTTTVDHENAVEAADLVAYYNFDDSTNFGNDSTLNNYDLTKVINSANIASVAGKSGNAVYFGGSAGLAIADVSNADGTYAGDFLDNIGGAFTISYYARIDTGKALNDTNARVFCNGINGSDIGSSSLVKYLSDGNKVQNISAVGGTGWWNGAAEAQNADQWHHYVMVYDPAKELLTAYIDGTKAVETYADPEEEVNADWNFCIGGCWAQWTWFADKTVTTESFIGAVDEFKVFNSAIYDMDYLLNAVPATTVATTEGTTEATSVITAATETTAAAGSEAGYVTTTANNVKTGESSSYAATVLLLAAAGTVLLCKKKFSK